MESGFEFPEAGVVFLPLHQVYGRRPFPPRLHGDAAGAQPIEVPEFTPGETVVHANRGISVFRGIEKGSTSGVEKEFMRLEFRDGANLLVPLDNADLVHRYVGAGGLKPELSLVAGKEWSARKARVRQAISGLALDLLEMQAMRASSPGIAFPPDTAWQAGFENAFPFEETPDQLRAAIEVKRDMEARKPMDRLICGDVGYGKTEVAMRAAFKAVSAGKQAAVLVPTTILAQQHFETFRERMAAYPVFIEMVSRFRTAGEIRDVIERTARGEVDILIGTHRLLGRDVAFKDLGLVIIDEEQRFGVRHKEHLKKLRATVDVLTLTATPIPRTLQMNLLGLKDISNLTTPPPGRQAIETKIIRFDHSAIAQAVRREMDRDGQVFFVHDKVDSILSIAKRLEQIVPEARIGVAHGQMQKTRIKSAMKAFLGGETQVLLTTTIIESGVDIPNVNTLFINNAHNFGLADLHQLRGRVGRVSRKAYAYLILPDRLPLREVAEKRLAAVMEYSELGAGFKIALRDLEIRGAGDLIGRDQSGHIASVGYEMYCRLLREAAKEIKEPGSGIRTSVGCDLPIDTSVPASYAGSDGMKLWLHKRVAGASSIEDIGRARAEAADMFGPPPPEVGNLLRLAAVRIRAEEAGAVSIFTGGDSLYVEFEPAPRAAVFLARRKEALPKLKQFEDGILFLVLPPGRRSGEGLLGFLEEVFP